MKRILHLAARMFPRLAILGRKLYYYWLPDMETNLVGQLESYIQTNGLSTKETFYFVQIGAHDGAYDDPIVQLRSKNKNWRGILLEPQRIMFDELKKKTAGERLKLLNVALDDCDGEKILYKVAFSTKDWATGLASFDRKALIRSFENGYARRMASATGEVMPDREQDWLAEEIVQTISYETLLAQFEFSPDLCIVDTEGLDHHIVNKLLTHQVLPAIWWFEYSYMKTGDIRQIVNRLKNHGYQLKRSEWDILAYKKKPGR